MAKEHRDREYTPGERIPGTEYIAIRAEARGGHGILTLVRHHFLGNIRMLKTLRAHEPSPDLAERLTREAKMLAGMKHPNIVEVVSGGITDEPHPRPYFVMERLRGCSLASAQVDTPEGVGIDVALQILIETCDALQYIHELGVIHRDVKPDNIFLERAVLGAGSNTKLLDFGVMHVLSTDKRQDSERMFVGTFRYAAPEQLFGDDPTPQTDIYALGLVGYEAITGRHPFAHCATVEDLARAQIEREPPPFPDAPCPDGLEALIRRMLRKEPAERPGSAKWLALQLRQIRLQAEIQAGKFATDDVNKTNPSPVQNRLTMTRAEPTDPGEAPEEAGEPPFSDPIVSTAPDTPHTQWLNQAATVERRAVSIEDTTEDSREKVSLSFLGGLSPSRDDPSPSAMRLDGGIQNGASSFSPVGEVGDSAPFTEPKVAPLARMHRQRIPLIAASPDEFARAERSRAAASVERASADSFEEEDRYQESELSDSRTPRQITPRMPARAVALTSNGVAISKSSGPVDRRVRVKWFLAAGVVMSLGIVAAGYVFFSRLPLPSQVSDTRAVAAPPSASAAASRPPTSPPVPILPTEIPPSSVPVSPKDAVSLAKPPPPPAPPVAQPSPTRAHLVQKSGAPDETDTSLLDHIDAAKGGGMPAPVAQPSRARMPPVPSTKDDVKREM